ncbi:DUF4399 domain-containing protein [Halomarina litorea]|uniref:DUF4399 domain-containing protein n=1 Tax=Halomarina litorea TaxID=2961595 RepID=UPI0020C2CA30|nr:DUF4399 domain-containing protein [Halomarina sp. BCD28]
MGRLTRRKFTGIVGTAAAAALAGCSDSSDGSEGGENNTTGDGGTTDGNETTAGNGTGNESGNGTGNGTGTADGGVSLPENASVAFVEPEDGATVTSPVQVEMQAEGFTVEPAGEVNENAGHFHVMVDAEAVPQGEVIPNDEQHIHFGDGSTTASLELEPGEHTLVLQPGNGAHEAYDVTDGITITVEEGQSNGTGNTTGTVSGNGSANGSN